MALWEVYTQQCNSQWNTWLGEASMMEKAQFRAEIKIEADKMQELLLAASQYVIALSQICSLASTITDFKLPHKHYRHLCSAWLCPSLYQIATEGGMVDSRQMEDCLKKHSRVDISAQVARAPFCPSPLRYITTTIELCISAAIKIEKIFDKTIGCLQELGETISNCAELSTEVSTVLPFGLKACCHGPCFCSTFSGIVIAPYYLYMALSILNGSGVFVQQITKACHGPKKREFLRVSVMNRHTKRCTKKLHENEKTQTKKTDYVSFLFGYNHHHAMANASPVPKKPKLDNNSDEDRLIEAALKQIEEEAREDERKLSWEFDKINKTHPMVYHSWLSESDSDYEGSDDEDKYLEKYYRQGALEEEEKERAEYFDCPEDYKIVDDPIEKAIEKQNSNDKV